MLTEKTFTATDVPNGLNCNFLSRCSCNCYYILITYQFLTLVNSLVPSTGPLVQKILNDMYAKAHGAAVDGKSAPNFLMYSGHDATLAINLQTLGLYNHQRPPYASAVLYELHQRRDGGHYVKVNP